MANYYVPFYTKRVGVMFLIFAMLIGAVCAENEWGDIVGENVSEDNAELDNENFSSSDLVDEEIIATEGDASQLSKNSGEYTRDFYIALGVGIFGLLIIVWFIYLFLRGPTNKWEKKRKVQKTKK